MSNEEVNQVLDELHEVRPEKLNNKAKRLFEAIMKIANARDKAEADLYEANNRINDLLDMMSQKEKIINDMAIQLTGMVIWDNEKEEPVVLMNEQEVIKYFEERCK